MTESQSLSVKKMSDLNAIDLPSIEVSVNGKLITVNIKDILNEELIEKLNIPTKDLLKGIHVIFPVFCSCLNIHFVL